MNGDRPSAGSGWATPSPYWLLAGAGLWTIAIGASLGVTLLLDRRAVEDLGRAQATTAYQELSRSKAFLMESGSHRLGESARGFRAHVTSLNAIKPGSQPDAWEMRALKRIASGAVEVSETSVIDGGDYLRLMHSLTVEAMCLPCHLEGGFRPGEVRGGMSLAVPLSPLRKAHTRHVQTTILGYGLVWLIGLGAWAMVARTLQRRTQEKQEIEATFRDLFDGAPVAYHELDLEGRLRRVNRAECELLGYEAGEMVGRPVWDFVASADCAASREAIRRKLNGTQPLLPIQRRYVSRDGREMVLEIHDRLVRNSRGEISGIRTAVLDITSRVAAERALHDREETLRTVCTSSLNAIVMIDDEGRTILWNPAAEQMFGYTAEEMIGQRLHELLAPADLQDRFRANLSAFQKTGNGPGVGKVTELRALHKDGTEFPIELALSSVQKGRHWQAVGVIRDITERKVAQERIERYLRDLEAGREIQERTAVELLKAKEAAESSNRAKSEFLANMSHEIRTPMNGVLGMAELALETNLTAEQREYISVVKNSGESLLAVLNDILDFSKIEAGKLDLDPIEFSLKDCLIDALRVVAPKAHEKGIELACEVDEAVPEMVTGDVGRLRQILLNLVNNAVKFTERGEVILTAAMDEGLIRFAVRDTGIGIAPEKVEMIFQPFRQADASTTRKFGGTGLGLSISIRLVNLMGGRIWVESVPGHGATFLFTARFAPAGAPPPPAQGLPTPYRVLAVDDNATNRRILEKQLERWGATPVMAEGGEHALAILDRPGNPFDLIITDCHMPEIDGFQFVREVHRRWPHYRGRVLMLSSASSAGDATQCRTLGVARHVLKPVKGPELLGAILAMIAEVESQGDARASESVSPSLVKTTPRSLQVLLAEDNLVNQRVAQRMLETLGHKVALAKTGSEAVALWKPGRFDLILMDIQMPEMDGFEATKAIRAQSGDTPIIALTAHAMEGDRERCLQHGMDGYLQKPLQSKELAAMLARHNGA